MPQLIQRPPVGLLALLDSKAGGRNPSILLDEIRPTLDLSALYEIYSRQSRVVASLNGLTGALIAAGVGTFLPAATAGNQHTPLPDEIWHVRYASIRAIAAPAAGTNMMLTLGILDSRNSSPTLLQTSNRFAGAAQFFALGVQLDLFIRPGYSFGAFVNEGTLAVDCQFAVCFDLYKPV